MVQAQASLALDDQLAAGWFGWLTNKGILKLNAILCLSLISSYATGYDGSKTPNYMALCKVTLTNHFARYDEWLAEPGYVESILQ
jgi:hypothetical protein